MTRTLYALTTDPYRTWEIAHLTPKDMRVESLFPQDRLPNGPVPGLVIDLDYLMLDRFGRARLLEQALDWVHRFPVAILSFNLEDVQEIALRAKGLIVSRSLDAEVIRNLLGMPPASAEAA